MTNVVGVDGRPSPQRPVLPPHDFDSVRSRRPHEVIATTIDWFRHRQSTAELANSVPPAASPQGIQELERELEQLLPVEYRIFLETTRCLILEDGSCIFGTRDGGAGRPWSSDEHVEGRRFLVVGEYRRCADGDQLLLDVGAATEPVFLYLHDPPRDRDGPPRRPCIEPYAPCFSLALHRLAREVADRDREPDED